MLDRGDKATRRSRVEMRIEHFPEDRVELRI
jgi:hypothetical protein